MIADSTSEDFTAFQALFMVHAEEAEREKDRRESGDDTVIVNGERAVDAYNVDDEDTDDDGAAE